MNRFVANLRALSLWSLVHACPGAFAADPHPHWSYEGKEGPGAWATLSPEYAECGRGTRQSPIDLPVTAASELHPAPTARMEVFHHEHTLDVTNNGHTVAVAYDDGDRLVIDGTAYQLVQYHFHAPSEHTFRGRHFPLELHLVHRAAAGALAVVGVVIENGEHNGAYDTVIEHLPAKPGASTHLDHVAIDIDALLPAARDAFGYLGSLTTPPCTEGVRWLVLRAPVTLDVTQIQGLAAVLHHNSRPTQQLHGRAVDATGIQAIKNAGATR